MPSAEFTELDAQVTRAKTVMSGAGVLIRGIAARIDAAVAAAGIPLPELTRLSSSLKTDADDLSAALAENTVASGEVTA